MADGQVVFEINGDNRKLNDVLRDTTSDIEREGKKWDKAAGEAGDNIQNKLVKAFKVVAASAVAAKVGKALLDFGADAVQAASDLQEVQNVVDVTFGQAGAAQIEKWAKAAGAQFGLTETQAKRFTSTLGAMAKSAGMAGPEIVDMSTDLAGLAADMASFYNLDFDTAFQKIRSGISGETEPLKQLGINMSVANLEAYALTQGITKAFDKMSQSEQIMLRYQYLMQATADAQGDFARTSDGYANAVRTLQTNIDNLKTSVGGVILPIVNEVVGGINDMIGALTQEPPKTVLDDFAAIDLKTEEKLAEIQQTAEEARNLVGVLEEIGGKQITSTSLTSFVDTLTGKINGLDGALSKAKDGDYAGTISEIAGAMAGATGGDASAWNTLLTAIGEKLPDAADATLDDNGQTAAFLEAAGAAADSLGGEYPALWAEMLGVLGDDAGAAITALANGATAAEALQGLANGANALNKDVDANKWGALLTALSTNGNIDLSGAGKSVEDLAKALNGADPNTDRAQAWQDLLSALSADVEGLSSLTGANANEIQEWLQDIAKGANALDPNSAEGWDKLFDLFVGGFPGLGSENVGDLVSKLTGGADDAETYLQALGYSTDEIADKQAVWLRTCKELVRTIPGLNDIINTETGEIKGGVQAVEDYVNAWEEAQIQMIRSGALQEMRDALQNAWANQLKIQSDITFDSTQLDVYKKQLDEIRSKYNLAEDATTKQMSAALWAMGLDKAAEYVENAAAEIDRLEKSIRSNNDALDIAQKETEHAQQKLDIATEAAENLGISVEGVSDKMEESAEGAADWSDEMKESATTALESTVKALEAVDEYYKRVRDDSEKSIQSVVSGFNEIITPAEKARLEAKELGKEFEGLAEKEIDLRLADEGTIPSIQNMTDGLEDQLKYLNDYQNALDRARERGVSDDVLAYLADGSVESYDYLNALANGEGSIEDLNSQFAKVQEAQASLADSLTETRLKADGEFQGLVDAAKAAAEDLDQYGTAESAMAQTVQGIADGIAEKIGTVQGQVDALNAVLANLGNVGGLVGGFLGSAFNYVPSHATGLDYVPFDNYLAQLHEGESVLTAEEARVWRQFKNGGAAVANTIDYEAMGGLMRDNIKPGGNVYLDGRIVGQVISQQQGNSLRTLERSGWQK